MDNLITETQLGGQTYQLHKLDAMSQWHLTRRLAPVLATIGISVGSLPKADQALDLDKFMPMIGPVAQMLSMMSDETSEFIIYKCLTAVRRKDTDKWFPLLANDGRTLMYADIDMVAMLRLTVAVLKHNLLNFTEGLGATLNSQSPSATSSATKPG
jgi:hypothetical protein